MSRLSTAAVGTSLTYQAVADVVFDDLSEERRIDGQRSTSYMVWFSYMGWDGMGWNVCVLGWDVMGWDVLLGENTRISFVDTL